ncbi:UDP-glucosyltransferase 29-like [Salvia miltiorrhiza]|uniref:UDP-glucosyltransferase 29-like n=1 Tax=Salvia miltiorrhiza TaxID=226208 RepID=UPI0025AC1BF5|nr:UDP-glucosyltransferase 29-like [Salvia miltiorrhiza]
METQVSRISILMFPWLAHGHIFPFLELAKAILHRKNLHIYLCSTSINFDSIKAFINKHALNSSIELVEIHLEPSEDLPPHHHTTKNLPPSLMLTLLKAFQTSYTSFTDIISALKPDLVVYDVFQPWSAKIAASQGISAVHFSIYGATDYSLLHHKHTFGEAEFPFPAIKFEGHELQELWDGMEFLYSIIHDVDQDFLFGNFKQSCDAVLQKTSREVEGKYIDYLSTLSGKKIVPVGPLITHTTQSNQESSEIIEWLSKKSQHSTVFISFGSEYFLSKSEIEEIAKGLELCSVSFIWIIRFPLGATVSLDEVLPEGFLERAGERGLVVTGWAPQADILGHENVGGFVSHCGWSSCMESMYFGVPVVAMPMKNDQPINARMLVEAGSCVEVSRSEDGVFKGEEISKAIRKVVEEEGGAELRRRARGLSERLKREEGQVLDEVAEQLWQLCLKKHTTNC